MTLIVTFVLPIEIKTLCQTIWQAIKMFFLFNVVDDVNPHDDIINNNRRIRPIWVPRRHRYPNFRRLVNQLRQRQDQFRLIANPNEADHNYHINTPLERDLVNLEQYLQLAGKLVRSIPLDQPPVNALNVLVSAFNRSDTFIPNVTTIFYFVRPFFMLSVSLIDNSITDDSVDIIMGGMYDTLILFKSIKDTLADTAAPHE